MASPWLRCGLLAAVASGACAPDDAESSTPSVVRLWRDLLPVAVETAEAEGAPRLLARLEGPGRPDLVRARPGDDAALTYVPFEVLPGPLSLTADDGWGVALPVDVGPGRALSVRVVARGEGADTDDPQPLVTLVEGRQPFDPTNSLDEDDLADLFDARRHATRVLSGIPGEERLVLTADFVTDALTRSLVVHLLAPFEHPGRTHRFEAVEVWERDLAAHLADGGRVPRLTRPDGEARGVVRLEVDREERVGLLALPPYRATWELPPAQRPRRLELAVGILPQGHGVDAAVRCLVEVDGARLLDRVRTAPRSRREPAWSEHVVELPAGARRLVLATEPVEGQPLVVLGHPTLLAGEGPATRPSVVIVSLDTLRPDLLGCYGGDPSLSRHIDALAAEGLRFTRAYSTTSYTLPSHGSLMTGQYPAVHGAVDVDDTLDPGHSPLLAEILSEAGHQTAGFTGGGYVSTAYGFGHGFDRYSHNDPVWAEHTVRGRMLMETMSWERSPVTAELLGRYDEERVVAWIEARRPGEPFFLFLHTYVVHNYAPDEEWMSARGLLDEGGPVRERPFDHKDRERFNEGEVGLLEEVYEQYMPYYEATIGMADAFVGDVLAALERAGLNEETMVVVTSDHGEEFGEHGFFGHGETLYDANTAIPLIVRLPGPRAAREGRVIDEPISLVDIAPWVLRVVGLEPDPRMAVGPPLGPVAADPPARRDLVIELDNHVDRISAVLDGPLKLHVELGEHGADFEHERLQLYDVLADPGEAVDLVEERPDDVARLRERLRRFHAFAGAIQPRDGGVVDLSSLPPEMRRQLQALGYLGGAEPAGGASEGPADPSGH